MERHRVQIWPEWSDADINSEKWDVGHAKKDKKDDKDKAKSPVHANLFEDPDGLVFLPSSLVPATWKRITDYVVEPEVPVVMDPTPSVEGASPLSSFDIYSKNERLMQKSELMRFIITQIDALWQMCKCRVTNTDVPAEIPQTADGFACTWRPWEHIYAMTKVGKGLNVPQYNPVGKYCVKLFYLGSWRRITVDDQIPYDSEDQPLLPRTANDRELWPILLTKALLKIAAIDFGSRQGSEVGDFKVINCLTGWLPETINISKVPAESLWSLVRTMVPEWKAPYLEAEANAAAEAALKAEGAEGETHKDEKKDKEKDKAAPAKEKEKEKKDKDKDKGKSGWDEPMVTSDNLQTVIFATFQNPMRNKPVNRSAAPKISNLKESGFLPELTHPVCLVQTRTLPLERPKTPPQIPSWKLVRPRQTMLEERKRSEMEHNRVYQCFELLTPFTEVQTKQNDVEKDVPIDVNADEGVKPETYESAKPEPKASVSTNQKTVTLPAQPPSVNVRSQSAKRIDSASRTANAPVPPSTVYYANNESQAVAGTATLTSHRSSRPQTGSSHKTNGSAKSGLHRSRSRQSLSTLDLARVTMARKWMELTDFIKCFDTIEIYHRPSSFTNSQRFSDLKLSAATPAAQSQGKHDKRPAVTQPLLGPEDPNAQYFFCDSLKPTEFLLTFSVVPRWPEPTFAREDGTSSKIGNVKTDHPLQVPSTDREHERIGSAMRDTATAHSNADTHSRHNQPHSPLLEGGTTVTAGKQTSIVSHPISSALDSVHGGHGRFHPGLLTIEPHRIKSLCNPSPILTLETTGVKSTMLRLPAGRHVLKFVMKAPLAYHLQISATNPFQFTDEETLLPLLVKESSLFLQFAQRLLQATATTVKAFAPSRDVDAAWRELQKLYNSPDRHTRYRLAGTQHRAFCDALYSLVRKGMSDNMTDEAAFAWRVFTLDCSFPSANNVLQLRTANRQVADQQLKDAKDAKGKPPKNKPELAPVSVSPVEPLPDADAVPENWVNRQPTAEEHEAVTCIQRFWRGHFARLIVRTHTQQQAPMRNRVQEIVSKTWNAVEHLAGGMDQIAITLLRSFVRNNQRILEWLPFGQDEVNKVVYQDFNGGFQIPSDYSGGGQKFLIFRDIFHVSEDNLLVPRLFCTLPSARLRIINNDSLEEEAHVFSRIAPRVFQKNRLGYTFIAEGSADESSVSNGRFRLRLLSTSAPLPATQRTELTCNFATRDTREYTLPNPNHFVFHYLMFVNTQDPRSLSLRIQLSKPNVFYRLRLYERVTNATSWEDETLLTLEGKTLGMHPINVPVLLLNCTSRDVPSPSKRKVSASKAPKSTPAKQSTPTAPSAQPTQVGNEPVEVRPRKYVFELQALYDSWRFTDEELAFLEGERNRQEEKARAEALLQAELEQSNLDGSKATQKSGSKAAAAQKAKEKKTKDSKTGQQASGSRPQSPVFDPTKPHFVLRMVAEPATLEEIELRKDNDRSLEISATKKAWEDTQPGRAQLAAQSRFNYLRELINRMVGKELPSELAEKIQSFQQQHDSAIQTLRQASDSQAQSEQAQEQTDTPLVLSDEQRAELEQLADDATLKLKIDETITQWLTQTITSERVAELLPPPDFSAYRKSGLAAGSLYQAGVRRSSLEQDKEQIRMFQQLKRELEKAHIEQQDTLNKMKERQIRYSEKFQYEMIENRERFGTTRDAFRAKVIEKEGGPPPNEKVEATKDAKKR